MDKITEEVRALIAYILEKDPEQINPETRFVEDLGMDSMTALEILAAIERKYQIKIPEEELTKITNLNQVLEITRKYIQ